MWYLFSLSLSMTKQFFAFSTFPEKFAYFLENDEKAMTSLLLVIWFTSSLVLLACCVCTCTCLVCCIQFALFSLLCLTVWFVAILGLLQCLVQLAPVFLSLLQCLVLFAMMFCIWNYLESNLALICNAVWRLVAFE